MRLRRQLSIVCLGIVMACASTDSANADPKPLNAPPNSIRQLQIDLSPALEKSLFFESILDEGQWVQAEADKAFFVLPVVFDPRTTEFIISKSTVRGRDAKAFAGTRLLTPKDGALPLDGADDAPVYEHVEYKAVGQVEQRVENLPQRDLPAISARSTVAPRKPENDKTNSPRAKPRTDAPAPTGFAALVFEIPKRAKELKFSMEALGDVTLDLECLRHAAEPMPLRDDENVGEAAPNAVAETLNLATSPSTPTAALAVARLTRARVSWPPAASARWVMGVDTTILALGAQEEPILQSAVWRYVASGPSAQRPSPVLSSGVLDFLALADSDLQRAWLRLIALGLAHADEAPPPSAVNADGGPAWSRPLPHGMRMDSAPPSAMALLASILRSEDEDICKEALEVLGRMAPAVADWSVLALASPLAQRLAIERLASIEDPTAARGLLRVLLRAPPPAAAKQLASHCERLKLSVLSQDDPILAAWGKLTEREDRLAFLTAIAGVDLRQVIYSDFFDALIRNTLLDATHGNQPDAQARENGAQPPPAAGESSDKEVGQVEQRDLPAGDKDLHAAVWSLVLKQAARILPPHGAQPPSTVKPRGAKPSPVNSTMFPLLVSRTARDPLVAGLADAARRGPRDVRAAALVALLRFGYADEAVRALTDPPTSAQQRELLLKELAAGKNESVVSRDALAALLGGLLRKDCAPLAPWILTRLADLKSKTGADQPDAQARERGNQWRLASAIKAGLSFSEFDQLIATLKPPVSDQASQWLQDLGHMTPQDAQRLMATREPAERSAMLDKIDFRRGQLADGRYGAIAVIETLAAAPSEKDASGTPLQLRWLPPMRRSVSLPALVINANEGAEPDGGQDFEIKLGARKIGDGLAINKPKSVGGPGRFSPALQVAAWRELSEGRLNGPSISEEAVGPLVLQHRAIVNPLIPGTMNLEIADYLRQALREQKVFSADQLEALIPKSLPITLRYGSFGSYYGCTPEIPPDQAPKSPPSARLLGVMLILEKTDP